MMPRRISGRARLCAGLALGAIAALPGTASAQSQGRFTTDVSATAAYSNNPFAVSGDDTGSALVILDVAPRYQILTERSALTLSADANLQQYLRRYGRNDSYSGAIDYSLRTSERTNGHVRLDLSSAVLGSFNSYLPPLAGAGPSAPVTGEAGATPADPVILPTTPILTDVGLFGLRNRRKLGRLSGDAGIGLSQRDTLTVSAYAEATRYGGRLLFGDFEAYNAGLGYSRRVSQYLDLGVRGSGSLFDYRSGVGDTRVYSVEGTASGRLSPLWTVNGALGVSFVEGGGAGSTRRTSLSGNVNLCRQGERSTMCAQAARQVSPTGLAGSQYATTVGLNWSKRLNERENLSLAANYSSIGTDRVAGFPGGLPLVSDYAQATVGYDRQIRQRLRFVASANYRQLLNSNIDRPADFGGQVGLSYRLGDVR